MTAIAILENTHFYSYLYGLVDGARNSVHISNFSFNLDENMDTKHRVRNFVKLLAKKRRAGVDVRVLLGNSYKADVRKAFEGLDSSNELTFTVLRGCGVPAGFFHHPRLGSSHSKYAVVDGKTTVLGSHNLSPRALTLGNDDSVAIEDNAVAMAVTRRFRTDWANAKRPPAAAIVAFNEAMFQRAVDAPAPGRTSKVNGAIPVDVLFEKTYFDRVIDAIRNARASIDICMFYFATSRSNTTVTARIANALIAARARGVAIRVILDRDKPGEIYLSEKINKQRYTQLKQAGIKVKWDSRDVASHTKLLIVDGSTVFIGSHNWTEGSNSGYQELSVAIASSALAARYTKLFERRFKQRHGT